jgi:hypothetical protein
MATLQLKIRSAPEIPDEKAKDTEVLWIHLYVTQKNQPRILEIPAKASAADVVVD